MSRSYSISWIVGLWYNRSGYGSWDFPSATSANELLSLSRKNSYSCLLPHPRGHLVASVVVRSFAN